MKKKVMIFLAVIIFIVAAAAYAVIDRTTDIYNSEIDSSDYTAVGLTEDGTVKQEFKSSEDYLDGMAVKLDASGNIDKILLDYKLVEKSSGKEIAAGEVSLKDVRSGKFFSLRFDRADGRCV